ncbi:MAG: hypothetical protein SF066_23340 [Thermoanaerobaculia bacterium]|nr:hypothetical protein [Thermoanaerobaculia bacterium]
MRRWPALALGVLGCLTACTTGRAPAANPAATPAPPPVSLPATPTCPPCPPPAPLPDPRPAALRTGDEAYERGEPAAAAAAYDAFLTLADTLPASQQADLPRVLARLVVLCSLPPTRDPVAAQDYHRRLVKDFAKSPYRAEADLVIRAGAELEAQRKKGQDLEREVARLTQLVEKLKQIDLAPRKPPG